MCETYDLLPVAWGLTMPPRVCDVLVDMGAASNEAVGGVLPLSAKEVGLMLRSGYSSEAVQEELSARHFAGAVLSAMAQD